MNIDQVELLRGVARHMPAEAQNQACINLAANERAEQNRQAEIMRILQSSEGQVILRQLVARSQQREQHAPASASSNPWQALAQSLGKLEADLSALGQGRRPTYGENLLTRSAPAGHTGAALRGGRCDAPGVHPRETLVERQQCGCWLCMR